MSSIVCGTTNSINIGNPETDPTVFTLMAWVYPTSVARPLGRALFWKGDPATGVGFIRFGLGSGGATGGRLGIEVDYTTKDAIAETSDTFIVNNAWQFWAATVDHTTNPPRLFWGDLDTEVSETGYDGVPAQSAGVGTRVSEGGSDAHMGNNQYQTSVDGRGSFPGRIAFFAWYPSILTDDQIIAHRLMTWNWLGNSVNPVGMWRPGQHRLLGCPDISMAGVNGTVSAGCTLNLPLPIGRRQMY